MPDVTMVGALNTALRDAMRADPRTLVFGEDVGALGGVFRVTEGLQDEFGTERVFNTPIAEAGIAGSAWGSRWPSGARSPRCSSTVLLPGARPGDQPRREVPRADAGQVPMPVVIRIPSFGGIKGKEHHGESPETYYAHTAGLKVVVPSSPLDAYRLLRRSIEDPTP